ncbi:hypothetical protein ACFOSC_09125 [Streptantibioticus rubrisoli]|uniref:Uncharacterized protein n=1 Tax=Streptantibioticus rubrisoli TaxID=1387313 RepID=A0ABT1P9E5_9ACTN|nr:hypothetical protein [Streptantibioticus rubrisoli]MCQ4040873.1 hypothetical protein [Streptantibioticus rubrisoli]
MRLGRKLAVGVVEETERIPESELSRDGADIPPRGEAEVSAPSEERPCPEEFASSAADS